MDTYTLDDNRQFMEAGFVPSIKCVLIGDYEVGKTSLINSFATREPLNQYFPGLTGPIQIHIEHLFRLYLLHIHDTEGTHAPSTETTPVVTPSSKEQGSPLRNLSDISNDEEDEDSSGARSKSQKWINRRIEYGLADVILICFSLADRTSFENVEIVWVKEIRRLCPHVPFIVIGCKLDLRRPDPTTPAPILAPRPQPSTKHMIRRPKPVRTSTASTTGSTTSPSSSDFGHHRHDSSSVSMNTRPPAGAHLSTHSILTSGTTASLDHEPSPSAPSSDLEHSNRKLKPSSSFSIHFPAAKAFRRKSAAPSSAASTTPTSSSRSRNPPSSYHTPSTTQHTSATTNVTPQEASRPAMAPDDRLGPPSSSRTNTGNLSSPGSPKSPRHVSLPPMLRSLSQVTVFRKVLSRPRSKSRHEYHNESSDASLPSPHDPVNPNAAVGSVPVRPPLVHRHTSGSATETSGRQLHTHVRTTSQPTPVVLSDHEKQQQQQETQPTTSASATAATTTSHSIDPTSPARRRTTRIEEPPIARRPRTTTYQEARSAARRLGASGYMECSALTLVNVVKVFDEAVRIAVERRNASASSLHGRGRRGNRNEECVTF